MSKMAKKLKKIFKFYKIITAKIMFYATTILWQVTMAFCSRKLFFWYPKMWQGFEHLDFRNKNLSIFDI